MLGISFRFSDFLARDADLRTYQERGGVLSSEEILHVRKTLVDACCGCVGMLMVTAMSIITLVLTIKVLVGASVSLTEYGACYICAGLANGMAAPLTLYELKKQTRIPSEKMFLTLIKINAVISFVMSSLAIGGIIPMKTLAYTYLGIFVSSVITQWGVVTQACKQKMQLVANASLI